MTDNGQLAEIDAGVPPDGIVFDRSSGISEEEQREIMLQINGIAEKNRRSFSEAAGPEGGAAAESKSRFTAKKSGSLFPILVNAAAAAFFIGGFLLLSSFQEKTDIRVREGPVVYNSAERALIEEIRRETASRIAAKEQEIASIVSKLADVDMELQKLHSSNEELSAEQLAAEEQLTALKTEYHSSLAILQDERSLILEDARAREANLRAQLEARIRELAAASEQNEAALSSAQSELERLSAEQQTAASIEAQMAGYFALVNDRIRESEFTAAAETLGSMRGFLNTPAFQGIRSIQARKDLYAQAINAMEAIVEAAIKSQSAFSLSGAEAAETALAELQEKNAMLEESVTALSRTVEAASSQGSSLTRRLSELESQAAALRSTNADLEKRAVSLEGEKITLSQTVADRETAINDLRSQNAARDNTINELRSQNAARDNTINELRSENAAQAEQVTNLSNQLTSLRQALQALSQ
jgi:chromosome segregation ATPase